MNVLKVVFNGLKKTLWKREEPVVVDPLRGPHEKYRMYQAWSPDDRQLYVGCDVVVCGDKHIAGQFQPLDDRQLTSESVVGADCILVDGVKTIHPPIDRDGKGKLEIKIRIGMSPYWELISVHDCETRAEAWALFDDYIKRVDAEMIEDALERR